MENSDIQQYYKQYSETYCSGSDLDLLNQVGKTHLGETISLEKLQILVHSIISNLHISKKDNIIDFGCANGLVTKKISSFVNHIDAYDLSKDLIDVANKYNGSKNISFNNCDILEIDFNNLNANKFYMYEVLQFFDAKMLRILLEKLSLNNDTFSFLIASIPDIEKIFSFYFNEERKKYYFKEVLENKKFHIGNWWYQEHILVLCEDLGLEATIIEQDKELHTAHYRFDVLIEKK